MAFQVVVTQGNIAHSDNNTLAVAVGSLDTRHHHTTVNNCLNCNLDRSSHMDCTAAGYIHNHFHLHTHDMMGSHCGRNLSYANYLAHR